MTQTQPCPLSMSILRASLTLTPQQKELLRNVLVVKSGGLSTTPTVRLLKSSFPIRRTLCCFYSLARGNLSACIIGDKIHPERGLLKERDFGSDCLNPPPVLRSCVTKTQQIAELWREHSSVWTVENTKYPHYNLKTVQTCHVTGKCPL